MGRCKEHSSEGRLRLDAVHNQQEAGLKITTKERFLHEEDSDFDHQSYVLKAPADESPISIQQIIDFIDNFSMKPEIIRKTVEHLTWKIQMQRVIDSIYLISE